MQAAYVTGRMGLESEPRNNAELNARTDVETNTMPSTLSLTCPIGIETITYAIPKTTSGIR